MASRHELGPTRTTSPRIYSSGQGVDGTKEQMVGVSMCVHMIALEGGSGGSLPLHSPGAPSTDGDLSVHEQGSALLACLSLGF